MDKRDSQNSESNGLLAKYLENTVGVTPAPLQNCAYFSSGEETIANILCEISKAKKYIFLEFFAIGKGVLWDSFYNVLKQKANEGVEVRIIYDAIGCLFKLPFNFTKKLKKDGIKVRMFNPTRCNIRNHRKIAIIDGEIAICGGINLSDEYANLKELYGHWKDSGVKIDGQAAWDMTLTFLSMWQSIRNDRYQPQGKPCTPRPSGERTDASVGILTRASLNKKETEDFSFFKPRLKETGDCATLCSTMFKNPHSPVNVSEHTIIQFIMRANNCVWITTPYLICNKAILAALYVAAQSGIDVRIITPYIADKKIVKLATESYYKQLIENKVRIFEYIPGFIHAKNIISDKEVAMVGTVNLDYRSLYLQHECGVCFFCGKIIDDIYNDYTETLKLCKEITISQLQEISLFKRAIQRISRIFAPFF